MHFLWNLDYPPPQDLVFLLAKGYSCFFVYFSKLFFLRLYSSSHVVTVIFVPLSQQSVIDAIEISSNFWNPKKNQILTQYL